MNKFITRLTRNRLGMCTALIVILFTSVPGFSQTKDSVNKESSKYRNVVKLSVSSWLLYPNSLHFGYERLIAKNQSISVFGGYNQFPLNLNLNISNTHFAGTKSKSGYMFGAEYRFYLPKENKYSPPHGLYIAPYVSYYNFSSDRSLVHTDSNGVAQSVNLNVGMTFLNIGGVLGYQFVVAKRFVIDAELFGPSFTYYTFRGKLDGQINGLDPEGTLKAVIDALKEKLPFLGDLSNGKQIYSSGNASQKFPAVGFRYSINIGFMF